MSVALRRLAVVVSSVLLVGACSANGGQGQSASTAPSSTPAITSVAMTDATKAKTPTTTTTPAATTTRSSARASASPTTTARRPSSTTKAPTKRATEILKSLSPKQKQSLLNRYRKMTPEQQRAARRQACEQYGVGC